VSLYASKWSGIDAVETLSNDKPYLIVVYKEDCTYCHKLHNDFKEGSALDSLSKYFNFIVATPDEFKRVYKEIVITMTPTIVLLNRNRKLDSNIIEGYVNPQELHSYCLKYEQWSRLNRVGH
jgi:thioredoxin-related protein